MLHGYTHDVFSPDDLARRLALLPHVRTPVPVHFPEEDEVGESNLHLDCRTILYQLLRDLLGTEHSVCSDQFVYWDAADTRRVLAPDVCVRLGTPHAWIDSWKVWERGAPQLAVEIVSASDAGEIPWEQKLARYASCGVLELVRFDPAAEVGDRLRVWDRIEGDLVERAVTGDATPCVTLDLHWVIAPADLVPAALRLARDAGGDDLLLTQREKAETAATRIAELEAKLRERN